MGTPSQCAQGTVLRDGTEERLIYDREVYETIGAAYNVYNEPGSGFLESVYAEALGLEFSAKGIPFKMPVKLPVFYKGKRPKKEFEADCIVFDKIVIELKCIPKLTRIEEAQLLNYLAATRYQVGLLINFGTQPNLEWRRFAATRKRA